jgi:lipid-A-disaccharide synthase
MEKEHILIVCGEASGDLNAASLARNILEISPSTKLSAVGGSLLKAAGAEIFYDIKDLSVMGLFSVLAKLPVFFTLKKLILRKINEERPDALILVDFSGFNLRLAKSVNKSIPVIYYVSPQVWASRPGRVNTIKKYISKMIVLFKFEVDFYKQSGFDVDFAGHPLLNTVKPSMEKSEFLKKFGLSADKATIALLPGSRQGEIKNILPVMLKTAKLISNNLKDIQFVIAKSAHLDWKIYDKFTRNALIDLKIVEGKTYDCLNVSSFALVASGTATLETAILEKPFAVVYKMGLLNYLFYRPQVRVPYIGIANIIAGRKIVPEFIQFGASAETISREVLKILSDSSAIEQMKADLRRVRSSLGDTGASKRAAELILNFLSPNRQGRL